MIRQSVLVEGRPFLSVNLIFGLIYLLEPVCLFCICLCVAIKVEILRSFYDLTIVIIQETFRKFFFFSFFCQTVYHSKPIPMFGKM